MQRKTTANYDTATDNHTQVSYFTVFKEEAAIPSKSKNLLKTSSKMTCLYLSLPRQTLFLQAPL
jgi:hypothetical protein